MPKKILQFSLVLLSVVALGLWLASFRSPLGVAWSRDHWDGTTNTQWRLGAGVHAGVVYIGGSKGVAAFAEGHAYEVYHAGVPDASRVKWNPRTLPTGHAGAWC